MKQIIVITRIDIDEKNDEFVKIFPGQKSPVSGSNQEQNLQAAVHDGIYFYDENKKIAEKIKSLIDDRATEVLIVAHYSGNFEGLRNALNNIREKRNWSIQKYSSGNKNYDAIVAAFQNLQSDPSKVELIYDLFSPDHIREAKLELLHNCIDPENIPPVENLDDTLSDVSHFFRIFRAEVKEIKRKIDRENLEKNSSKELTGDDEDYITALTGLRKSLLES